MELEPRLSESTAHIFSHYYATPSSDDHAKSIWVKIKAANGRAVQCEQQNPVASG